MDRDVYLSRALEEVSGPSIVLDSQLRIVAYTPQAEALFGGGLSLGVAAPKVLCGHGEERPVAEALAQGRPVVASILRPDDDGRNRLIRVRAHPFGQADDRAWLLILEPDPLGAAADDDVLDHGMVTRNARMKQLLRDLRKVASSEASVLVRGETGSGKELVARAIHAISARRDGPFRAINCAALPAALLESELFGHTRGAFTGAVRDHLGHFRLAEGGTLFLDEVAELPLELQAKLLRVLQERTVIPLGASDAVPVDVRVVSATHRALRREVEAHRFRADLMYRLRVVPLYLPALRERTDDIELLAWTFLERHEARRTVRHISPEARARMLAYRWPGNVRELENVIEYATLMGSGPVLNVTDLPPELREDGDEDDEPTVTSPDDHLTRLAEDLPPEGRRLLNALERAGGHMGRAAASLGISRTTLWRRLKRFGLDRDVVAGSRD